MIRARNVKNGRTRNKIQHVLLDAVIVDAAKDAPLQRQLYEELKQLILTGTLRPGTVMPSTRHFSADHGIGRNTVIAAYEQLASEGFLDTSERSRSTVANLALAKPKTIGQPIHQAPSGKLSKRGELMCSQPRQRSIPGEFAFHPGTPEIRQFPFDQWRRLMANRVASVREDIFGYHSISGYPALKESITTYLRSSRNVDCDPSRVVITTGAQAALDLLSRLLLDPGDHVLMEEPGYMGAQSSFLAAGAELHPLHVSSSGWDLDNIPDLPIKALYLTPSCQLPMGVTMRMEQRLRLLETARQRDIWVIEDDFDSEYRFVGQPIPAMQGSDPNGKTIYVGTFAKTLFPALRLGFVVLPPGMTDGMRSAINITGQYPPLVLQATLADFMDRGFFARHLRRMRRLYAKRRERFIEIARETAGQWLELQPSDAGIQTLWHLESEWRDIALAEAAADRQLNIGPLSRHFRHAPGKNGLILGYAAVEEPAVIAGFSKLCSLLQSPPGRT